MHIFKRLKLRSPARCTCIMGMNMYTDRMTCNYITKKMEIIIQFFRHIFQRLKTEAI